MSSRFNTHILMERKIGAGVPLGILSIYEPLCGIACANLPFLYKLASGALKKSSSYNPSHTGESLTGGGYRARQNSSRRYRSSLSRHSEGVMLSRNGNDSTTLIAIPSKPDPEIELLTVERSYSMSQSGGQEILGG